MLCVTMPLVGLPLALRGNVRNSSRRGKPCDDVIVPSGLLCGIMRMVRAQHIAIYGYGESCHAGTHNPCWITMGSDDARPRVMKDFCILSMRSSATA